MGKRMKNTGFTLIELLVVVAIIGILATIVLSNVNAARDRVRFTNTIQTMNSVEKAATIDYNENGDYAPDVGIAIPPRFVPQYLSSWPTPLCPNWTYDWENWLGGTIIRVSLRRPDASVVFYYCIDTTADCSNGSTSEVNIKTVADKTLTCNE